MLSLVHSRYQELRGHGRAMVYKFITFLDFALFISQEVKSSFHNNHHNIL